MTAVRQCPRVNAMSKAVSFEDQAEYLGDEHHGDAGGKTKARRKTKPGVDAKVTFDLYHCLEKYGER